MAYVLIIVEADIHIYFHMLDISRDSRVFGLVLTGTWAMARRLCPACMIVSNVYVYPDTMLVLKAASRLNARNPLGASGIRVPDATLTTQLPTRCKNFFVVEKCRMLSTSLSPITTSARPSKIGCISLGISPPLYWLSASVFTMMSAPR